MLPLRGKQADRGLARRTCAAPSSQHFMMHHYSMAQNVMILVSLAYLAIADGLPEDNGFRLDSGVGSVTFNDLDNSTAPIEEPGKLMHVKLCQ